MLFGHNTDVKVGETVYHVQTEDRGVATAVIDTTVYCRGQVVHRCTTNYQDLLPLQAEKGPALRARIDGQHNAVIERVRGGEFSVAAKASASPALSTSGAPATNGELPELCVELLNAKEWLAGKQGHLQVAVREKQDGVVTVGAKVVLRMNGVAEKGACSAQTGNDGTARFELELPQVAAPEAAVILEATHGKSKGQLKFYLRPKAKQPA
jgi:hypothetical protein